MQWVEVVDGRSVGIWGTNKLGKESKLHFYRQEAEVGMGQMSRLLSEEKFIFR